MRSRGFYPGRPAILVSALLLACAVTGVAGAAKWTWSPLFAESMLDTSYQTVDPWALKDARERLADDLSAGYPEMSTQIRHDRQDISAAKRAASPARAACSGVGKASAGRYARFRCTVRLTSGLSAYQARKRVRLVVTGRESFRLLAGWG